MNLLRRSLFLLAICLSTPVLAATEPKSAQQAPQAPGHFGVRAGAGTDINLGVAFGAGGNYFIPNPMGGFELGALFFGGLFNETSNNGTHTYTERTTLFVFAALAEHLFNYATDRPSFFFIAGLGLAAIYVNWNESSRTDTSLGTPLPGGGTQVTRTGATAGTVFDLGVGYHFSIPLDLRLQIPVILTFSPPGGSPAVLPTLILTLGWRFG